MHGSAEGGEKYPEDGDVGKEQINDWYQVSLCG
jgi:hypothetical protein